MKHFTRATMLLMMLLIASSTVFAQVMPKNAELSKEEREDIMMQLKMKKTGGEYDKTLYPTPRQGGDDISTATLISSLPYTDFGTTSGYTNDYDEVCPYSGGTAPDVVYEYNPTDDMIMTVSLCGGGTDYDSKVYVYEDNTSNAIACNDDECGLQSEVTNVNFTAGHTYYIVVDGYGTSNGNYELFVDGTIVVPTNPIASFPYFVDYEDGMFPNTQELDFRAESSVYIDDDPTGASDYVARLEGDNYSGWSGGSTTTTYSQAFTSNTDHIAGIEMIVEPSGDPGQLLMEFDLRQEYDYGPKYSWFRVLVNGTAITDVDGNLYFNPTQENGEPFMSRTYDLSPWQGDASFTLTLQGSHKYDDCYSQVDNLDIYYLTLGNVEGYVYNDNNIPLGGVVVGVEGEDADTTGPDGYYFLEDLPGGMNNVSAYKEGYNVITHEVDILAAQTVQQDFIMTQPEMYINPLSLDVVVNPNEYYETNIGVLNNGSGPLDWTAEIEYVQPTMNLPIIRSIESGPDSNPDADPNAPASNNNGSRDMWDIQIIFDAEAGAGSNLLAGSECDGEYFYGTNWSGNEIYKYELDGTFVESFTISGVSALRDLAYDGTYFYGSNAGTSIWEMDFDSQTLVSTISSPTAARAIAYDSDNDAFWVNNWSSTLTLVSRTGSTLNTISNPPSIYGMAYDNYSDGGPYLWLFSGTTSGGGCQIEQLDIASGALTGVSHSVSGDISGGIAGGLWLEPIPAFGTVSIGGMAQATPDQIFSYELMEGGGPAGGWLSLDFYEGTVPPNGGNQPVGVNFDATGFESGTTVYANIIFTSIPDVGVITVPVSMTVQGAALGSVSDLEVELTNMVTGEVEMSWTGIGTQRDFLHYQIRRNNINTATTTNTSYTDYLPDYGEYCYTVYAVYDEGNTAPAGPECVDWFIPTISVDPLALSATVWEGGQVEVEGLTIENTGMAGSVLQYTFAYDPANGFIYDVIPEQGYLDAGQEQEIRVIYNAEGYAPGTYTQELDIESNDPLNATVTVDNTMEVLQPAAFAGRVTDGNTTLPIQGVSVTAGGFQAMTNNNGEYMLYVDAGTYDVMFAKPGYQSVTVEDQTATAGNTTTVDAEMFEQPYPPQFVIATVNDDDTECLVEWGDPAGPYEIVYDDGTAENMFVWATGGAWNAVKFTPAGYPSAVTGGKIFIGDGFFPQGGDILGTNFGVAILDDDGVNGMPGTVLDSISVTVNNFGWVEFDGFMVPVEEGDFYLAMIQGGAPPNTAGIGVDEEVPTAYRSYSKPVEGNWTVSTFQDFMIRAIVDGPVGTSVAENFSKIFPPKPTEEALALGTALHMPKGLPGVEKAPEYKAYKGDLEARGVEKYRLIRYANFDPNDPEDMGDASTLSSALTVNEYNDAAFGGLDMGWYKYGVSANFTNGDWSDTAISNIVGHLMDYSVTVYVSTTDGGDVEGSEVTLSGYEWPYEVYTATVPASGEVTIEEVWRGEYLLEVYLPGYFRFELDNQFIYEDTEIYVVLEEKTYPPRNLWVDPLTSIAYWNGPIVPPTFLSEDFEGGSMPNGWTTSSEGDSEWYVTQDGSSSYFNIPAHTYYAVCNDDAPGSGNNGCCDYLVTPVLDLRDFNDYILRFQSYYTGDYGQLAFVEYSNDGENFDLVDQMSPSGDWEDMIIDLSSISGNDASAYTWLAFHADDGGDWATGWAVDDVTVASAAANGGTDELEGYQVFLDGVYVASTPDSSYQYVYLLYNTVYTAGVAAKYSSGLSEMITYTFRSEYLIPPRNLEGENIEHSAYLTWDAPIYPAVNIPPFRGEIERGVAAPSLFADPNASSNVNTDPEFLAGTRGSIAWGDDVINDQWYSIDVDDYTVTNIASAAFTGYAGDFGRDLDDVMYVIDHQGVGNEILLEVDVNSGQGTVVGSVDCPLAGSGGIMSGLASDKATGVMYAMATDISQSTLTTLDLGTGTVTEIGTTTDAPGLIDIAMNGNSGQMYGIDIVNDNSYLIDKSTGAATELGALGFDANYAQGANWDPANNIVYLAAYNGANSTAELRVLDENTGATTLLTQLPGETGAFGFPGSVGGGGGEVPDNLVAYNIYRDSEWISRVDREMNEYYDFNLEPGTYEYAITAVYDLQPYGLPGEEGESMEEGPVSVQISYGLPIPFTENWDFGNFEAQQWQNKCDNWWVNTQMGNPAPAAEFTWDDTISEYRCYLKTYPILGSEIIDGNIVFDFDIKLNDRNESETEMLTVEIWENGTWTQIAEYTNAGSFDWTTESFEITDVAKGNDFIISFVAHGENSVNINGWFIDNINVYQVCSGPINLEALYTDPETEAEIKWIAPGATYGEWIDYNDNTFENALASTNGGAGLAQLMTPPDYPATVTKVRYWNSDFQAYDEQNEIYILTGDGATILGGPYYVNNGPAADWVEIDVDPITITEGSFMVATINTNAGGPFVGVDDSFYNGTLYFGAIGDWTELSELGQYFYVGSHEAYVEMEVGENVVLNSHATAPNTNNGTAKGSDVMASGTFGGSPEPMNSSRDLLGFNIYRQHNDGDFIKLNEELWPQSPYFDEITMGGDYAYYVTAVYDQCEGISDTVYIMSTVGVDEIFSENSISVYPNPAQDLLNVESTFDINKVTVMNYVGQAIENIKVAEDNVVMINTSNFDEGAYFIKVETNEGVITKKFVIAR
ncbi:MAG: carboxypeptidase regulatory-like domain-containing protein [Bacteroidales bacterium]|nr:carboxypeptidase regulatory-like domain-containing protein [Bacteroidales bacterium]MCF8376222.1 carboxypeptidase regulatory-like domain-containing protein [Bacteroidales bacterium]